MIKDVIIYEHEQRTGSKKRYGFGLRRSCRRAGGRHGRRRKSRPPVRGVLHGEHPEPEHAARVPSRVARSFFAGADLEVSRSSGSVRCMSRRISKNSAKNFLGRSEERRVGREG